VLAKLKSKNSCEPDGLSSVFLKKLAPSISFPLMLIFSQSFQCGIIPDIWRNAIVTPVFKKGLSCDVNNYIHITYPCVCCKITESIIKQKCLIISCKIILFRDISMDFFQNIPRVHNCSNVLTIGAWR